MSLPLPPPVKESADILPFRLHCSLNWRQRLLPHLKIWAAALYFLTLVLFLAIVDEPVV